MPDFGFKMKDGTWGLFKIRVRVSWDVPSARPSLAEYSRFKMEDGTWGIFKSVSRSPLRRQVDGTSVSIKHRSRHGQIDPPLSWLSWLSSSGCVKLLCPVVTRLQSTITHHQQ